MRFEFAVELATRFLLLHIHGHWEMTGVKKTKTNSAEVRFIYPSAVFYFNCEKSQFTQTVVMPGSHRKGELPVNQNQEWKLFG